LSDEIGSGFALLVAGQTLGTTVFLDTADAIRRRLVRTQAPNSLVPDYIGFYGPNGETVILEAKGTQSRWYSAQRQIPKGCEQVASVALTDGAPCLRVVVGVELRKDVHPTDTTVFFGDPEERHAYTYQFEGTPRAAAVRQHYARIAALVGDWELLRHAGERVPEGEPAPLVHRTVAGREVIGSTFEVWSGRSITGFFAGIDLLTRENVLHTLSSPVAVSQPAVPGVEPGHGGAREEGRLLSHFSIARDGTVLELWAEGDLVNEITAAIG
jgi:hypothetical protein